MFVSKFKGMERIILIGNGMVGHKFCSCFAEQANKDKYSLRVFGEEVRPAYDRVHLSEFFSKGAEPLALASSDWYEQEGISLRWVVWCSFSNNSPIFNSPKPTFPFPAL